MLLGYVFAHSQSGLINKTAFSIGLKANANIVGIANQNNYGQNEMDYEVTSGFGAGVALGWHFDSRNAVLVEISYQTHGQKYEDSFKSAIFRKEVSYNMISVPLLYRRLFSEPAAGYAGVGSESKPRWYILGGVQVDRILSPEVDWYINGQETDFLSFVLEGGNPNTEQIEAMGAPASDDELFTDWDIMFVLGGGFELPVNTQITFSVELRGGIGLTDLNAKDWRLENNNGIYGASRNSFAGLHAGLRYIMISQ